MFDVKDIHYGHYNERDVEGPALLAAIKAAAPVCSFLDVGAHYSWYSYAHDVRLHLHSPDNGVLGPTYTACDVIDCERTRKVADKFYVGNIRDLWGEIGQHDFVACVSAIEHSGISTYKVGEWNKERHDVFEALCRLARRELFVTFPFGREGIYEDQYANVCPKDLQAFVLAAKAAGLTDVSLRFFATEFAQGQKPWEEITYEQAKDIPLDKQLGTQCVCIFHAKEDHVH